MVKAQLVSLSDPKHHQKLSQIISEGGVVGAIWGYHLYFLTCNAYNLEAVKRMNQLKGRAYDQVVVAPGAIEEVAEFADIKKSQGLKFAAQKIGMKPLAYLESLFKKFPLGIELYANAQAPSAVTFQTKNGKTIWIAGHMADSNYSKFLATVRNLRRAGKNIVFAGTSLNLKGEDTLTVKQADKVVKYFSDKIDAISLHPSSHKLKKTKYSTSCSVVSFIKERPQVLRIGCSPISTLQKYIPELIF